MSFKPVGSLIGTSVSRSKTPDAILALRVRQVAKDAIVRELFDFPEDLVDSVKVKSYKKGELIIGCPPIVAAELTMRVSGLTDTINRAFGKKIIRGLRFRVL